MSWFTPKTPVPPVDVTPYTEKISDLEEQIDDLEEQIQELNLTNATYRTELFKAGVTSAQIDAVNRSLSDNAKATEEAGRAIAYALGALAAATERGARAKQREVEIQVATAE